MKIKRAATLGTALEEISSVVEGFKESGAAKVNGHEIKLDEPVTLEIEMESKKNRGELEFEIKWPREKRSSKDKEGAEKNGHEAAPKKGKRGRVLLGIVTGAALGAAAFTLLRNRRQIEDDDFALD